MSSTNCYKSKKSITVYFITAVSLTFMLLKYRVYETETFFVHKIGVKDGLRIERSTNTSTTLIRTTNRVQTTAQNQTTPGQLAKGYLCPYFRGGLGNHMFIYASLYGIGKLKGMKIVIDKNDEINKVFSINAEVFPEGSSACKNAPNVYEKRACAYDNETVSFNTNKTVKLKAYLQSWKYFIEYEHVLRRQFTFLPSVQKEAQDLINNYCRTKASKNITSTVIGVHLRRGDYLNEHNKKYGYNVATKSYIDRAMKTMRTKFPNCLFLVFTGNDKEAIKWRDDNIRGDDIIHVPPNNRNVDMCALSKCNHTIITVGTFGWWSAWLANGTTIYFKNVAAQNSTLRKDFSSDMSDFFLPQWIGLE